MATHQVQQIVARVREDLRTAQLNRDRTAMSVLREILAIVHDAEAVEARQGYDYTGTAATEVPRRDVSITEMRSLLSASVAERIKDARAYREHDEHDRAADLEAEAAVIARYLDVAP